MHENRNLFLFLIKINNMHRTRHILPIPRTCIWRRCGRCSVSWHRIWETRSYRIQKRLCRYLLPFEHNARTW